MLICQDITILYPHQLFKENPLLETTDWVILIEEYLFFRNYPFHRQKLTFHRASMRAFEEHLVPDPMIDAGLPVSKLKVMLNSWRMKY